MYTVVREGVGTDIPTRTQNCRFLSDASHLHGSEKAACSQLSAGNVQIASFIRFDVGLTAKKLEITTTHVQFIVMLQSG
jgi:hypothetical protein